MKAGIHLLARSGRPTAAALTPTSALSSQAVCLARDSLSQETKRPQAEEGEDGGASNGRFRLHKSRGQHLLTNPRVLDSIVRRADIRSSDTILEIGPGTGNLTVRLLQSATKVVAVEIDPRMVGALRTRVSQLGLDHRLTVITDNALKTHLPHFDLCVANIPYGISSPLIAKLFFESRPPCFRSATLLLQKEFAERLLAVPGDSEFNRLAANVGLVATVELLMDVSKRDFVPCPKVDSSLVRIRPKVEIQAAVELDEWLAFTRTCFGNKNKTLGAIFKQKRKIFELFERTRHPNRGDSGSLDDDGGESDEDDNKEMEGGVSDLTLFKEKIVRVLKLEGFEEKRPSKMTNEELLHILQQLNQEGIMFH